MTQIFALALALFGLISPLKVTVDGDGYLRFLKAGRVVYAKSADLTDVDGQLGCGGAKLMPTVDVPSDALGLNIDLSGNITATGPSGKVQLGKIVLATFPPAETGQKQGSFLTFADRPSLANPGDDTAGVIRAANGPTSEAPLTTSQKVAAKTTAHPANSGVPRELEVVVHQHSELAGSSFTVSDIATVSGPADKVSKLEAIKIGDNVLPAVSRAIDPKYVSLKLRGAGFQPGEYVLVVPDGADVVRKSKTITSEELTAAAIQAVKGSTGSKIEFRAKEPVQQVTCADGDVTIEPSAPEQTPAGFAVTITVRQGATIVGARTVTVVPDGAVAILKAGDPVSVILKAGAATVEVQGRVLSAGYLGQRVQVSVAGVGNKTTTHIGTVIDGGKVEVTL